MLGPFPLKRFRGGFGEIEPVVVFSVAIALQGAEGDIQRSIGGDVGYDRIKGIGRSALAVDGVRNRGHVKDSLCPSILWGKAAHDDGNGYRGAILPDAKRLSPG